MAMLGQAIRGEDLVRTPSNEAHVSRSSAVQARQIFWKAEPENCGC